MSLPVHRSGITEVISYALECYLQLRNQPQPRHIHVTGLGGPAFEVRPAVCHLNQMPIARARICHGRASGRGGDRDMRGVANFCELMRTVSNDFDFGVELGFIINC